jgi:hypothetical protein
LPLEVAIRINSGVVVYGSRCSVHDIRRWLEGVETAGSSARSWPSSKPSAAVVPGQTPSLPCHPCCWLLPAIKLHSHRPLPGQVRGEKTHADLVLFCVLACSLACYFQFSRWPLHALAAACIHFNSLIHVNLWSHTPYSFLSFAIHSWTYGCQCSLICSYHRSTIDHHARHRNILQMVTLC